MWVDHSYPMPPHEQHFQFEYHFLDDHIFQVDLNYKVELTLTNLLLFKIIFSGLNYKVELALIRGLILVNSFSLTLSLRSIGLDYHLLKPLLSLDSYSFVVDC